jgi:hypothetical protein
VIGQVVVIGPVAAIGHVVLMEGPKRLKYM